MLTVRALLEELGLELAVGGEAADAPLRWVHISELPDPTPWLAGGELLLTTGIQLGSAERQRDFVRRLGRHQLAGLGFGTGFDHEGIPEPLLDEAEAAGFPVFEVPYELPFIAITEKAFTRPVSEQHELLQRGIVIYKRLERLVLEERGLDELVCALAASLGGSVTVLSPRGETIAMRSFRRPLPEDALDIVRAEVRARSGEDAGELAPDHPELAGRSLALPVAMRGRGAQSSFHEARCALEAVALGNAAAREVASWRDLGAFRLLLSLQGDEALRLYCDSVLGPLEDRSGEYGNELIRSLEAFIEQNGQWERAARQLYCHRHTLRYRIRRVEQLTGRDLSSARDRIEFWLALRARELIR